MSFLAPLFLIAAAAGAIPVVLHMINRQKAREVPFSTLRFLQISVQKTRRRQRLHDVLLMVVRAAVLVLIALGLASPTITSLPSFLGSGSSSAVAIILDNSASMATIGQRQPRFETARRAATQIFDQLEDGDQAALLLTGGPPFSEQGRLGRTHERARQMLAAATISHERADLGQAVQQARQLLADAEAATRQIFVITDMQRLSWDSLKETPQQAAAGESEAKEPGSSEIPVIIIDCNRSPQTNVAVAGVRIDAAMPVAGLPITAAIQLFNPAKVAQKRHLELFIDGVKHATSPAIDIPPDGSAGYDFRFTFDRGGLHRCEARLAGSDGCRLDDSRFFAVNIRHDIPVAVVTRRKHEIAHLDDAFYLEQALSAGSVSDGPSALRVKRLTAAELPAEPLSQYKVVFCVNLPAPSSETARLLVEYVENGGNLFWIAGDELNAEAYNQVNDESNGLLLPLQLGEIRTAADFAYADGAARDSWQIAWLDKEYHAFEGLLEPNSLFTSVLVYRHLSMAMNENAKENSCVRVLANLDDGEPLLVERAVGHGKILMLGASLYTDWTNFPLRPIFLPLIMRTTFELAGVRQGCRQIIAGAPIALQFENRKRQLDIEIVRPTGETVRQKTRGGASSNLAESQIFEYADTHTPGTYVVDPISTDKLDAFAFSVNTDPDESQTDAVSRDELTKRLGGGPVVFADNPDDLSATFDRLRYGRGLWELFLCVVLIGLVFETFLSNKFSASAR